MKLWSPEEFRACGGEQEAERLIGQAEQDHPGASRKATEARASARCDGRPRYANWHRSTPRYEAISCARAGRAGLWRSDCVTGEGRCTIRQFAADLRRRYHYLLVDEFQDINYASGELIRLLDGGRGRVWAGRRCLAEHLSLFARASAANLDEFPAPLPDGAGSLSDAQLPLVCKPILDASAAVMVSDPRAATRPLLQAQRTGGRSRSYRTGLHRTVRMKHAAIAHDILRRVRSGRGRGIAALRRATVDAALPEDATCTASSTPVHSSLAFSTTMQCSAAPTNRRGAIAAVLEAHGIPGRSSGQRVREASEVKDVLAICAQIGSTNSAGLLRALTMPDHRLDPQRPQPACQSGATDATGASTRRSRSGGFLRS
jgi:DNA helicase-2/ATP-dependent DNA helicase PcrA